MKARHHLLFFIIFMLGAMLLLSASARLLPIELQSAIFRSLQVDATGHFIGFFLLAWLLQSSFKTIATQGFDR